MQFSYARVTPSKCGVFIGCSIGGDKHHNSASSHSVTVIDSFEWRFQVGRSDGDYGAPKTSVQGIHSHWARVKPLTSF